MTQKKVEDDIECVLCKAPVVPKKKWTTKTRIIAGLCGTVFVGSFAVTVPFLAPALRRVCLPYIPATPNQLRNIRQALHGRTGTLLDIGSGDGRVVIEASKLGFQSSGVELNYWLVLYSRLNSLRHKQWNRTKFYKQDLWKTDLSQYQNIVIFGVDTMMVPLERKFEEEITSDCCVLAARFPLPSWQPASVIGEGIDRVWIYVHPDHSEGYRLKHPTDTDQATSNEMGKRKKKFDIFELT